MSSKIREMIENLGDKLIIDSSPEAITEDSLNQWAFELGDPAENGDGYTFTQEQFDQFANHVECEHRHAIGALLAAAPVPSACCVPSDEDKALLASGDYTPEELWGGSRPTCPKCIDFPGPDEEREDTPAANFIACKVDESCGQDSKEGE